MLVEGFFEPQSWEDVDGKRVRLVFAVTHITTVEKEQKAEEPEVAEVKQKAKPRRKKSEKEA